MPLTTCLVCAADLPVRQGDRRRIGGRPQLYCSGICRQRAYRYRDDAELAEILNALATGRLHPTLPRKDNDPTPLTNASVVKLKTSAPAPASRSAKTAKSSS